MFQTSGKSKAEDLGEFQDAREVVAGLSAEYLAFEQPGGELQVEQSVIRGSRHSQSVASMSCCS